MGMKVTLKWIMENIQVVQMHSRMPKYVLHHHLAWDSLSGLVQSHVRLGISYAGEKRVYTPHWRGCPVAAPPPQVSVVGSCYDCITGTQMLLFRKRSRLLTWAHRLMRRTESGRGHFPPLTSTHRHAPHWEDLPRNVTF